MKVVRNKIKIDEPFTQVPNRVIRSTVLDCYDKNILMVLMSCNPSFPTYETIAEWTAFSRERIWKSLRKLEGFKIIKRFQRGRCVEYIHFWDPRYAEGGARGEPLRFDELDEKLSTTQSTNSSPGELNEKKPVRQTNYTSSPDELAARRTVRRANSKKKKYLSEKEQIKIGPQIFDIRVRDPKHPRAICFPDWNPFTFTPEEEAA